MSDYLDEHKHPLPRVPSRASPMTPNGLPRLAAPAGKRSADAEPTPSPSPSAAPALPRLQRPSMTSQHSSSVPSTPLQLARKYESRSRSPSPNGGLGSHSPRSVSSEANSAMPTLRPSRPFKCKYETNVGSLGRRRVPYHSSDLLEPPPDEPAPALDPHQDGKLSGDMRELYDRLQPAVENTHRRDRFVRKIQRILETEFHGNDFRVHVFGSSGNMLYTSESDVDICVQTPMTCLEEMHSLAEALDKHGMERVVCIPQAKVRIVKVWDPELELACDINVNNVAALENTRLIKTYIQIDERVRPLAMILKHWTKQRILNDAGIGGTISSYTWMCMILNFLQTRNPPILPALHNLPFREVDKMTGQTSHSGFADDVDRLRGYGDGNTESIGQLLFHFFRLYGYEVDYEKEVMSVRQGKRIKREEKGWHPGGGQKEGTNRLCVEEPFNVERNLGNSADDYAWRGIHLEIRRAFDLLAHGQQLDKACEQFEFPAEEKPSAIFQKPRSQKATITSSVPIRSSRGGSNHRGGRGGFNLKGQNANSRRSSGGQNYVQGRPPFLHSPPIANNPGQEYFAFPRGLHDQLHDQLFQQYQMLEMQSNSLRAQLAAQQHAQQAHQVRAAQMHAHAVAQAQAQHRGSNGSNGTPQKPQYVNGGSSPRVAELGMPPNSLPQGFFYHYPGFFNPAQSDLSSSQDGPRTNPSSPSLSSSMPGGLPGGLPGVRRSVHRDSSASETSSIRSQSQPARGFQQQPILTGYPPMPQFYDPSVFAGYPVARSSQDTPETPSTSDAQSSPLSNNAEPSVPSDHCTPKEYVGYYVAEQPPARSLQDYAVGQIPSFSELAQRRRRVSSEVTQPLLNTALRRVSRSPSPLGGHVRNHASGLATPALSSDEQRRDRIDSTRAPTDLGPVIVNGSFPAPPRELQNRIESVDEMSPVDFSSTIPLGPYAAASSLHQMKEIQARQQLVLEEMQRQQQQAVDMMGSQAMNGFTKGGSAVDSDGLVRVPSEGQQSFPTLPDGWMNYDSSKGRHDTFIEEISPTRTLPPQWRVSAHANGLSSLDTANVPRAPPQEIKSANLPLLSPVFETRTPSPTVSRQVELGKVANGVKAQGKDTSQQSQRAPAPKQQAAGKENNRTAQQKSNNQDNERSKPNSNNGSAGSWQPSQPRKKKNNNRKKANEHKTTGEALPVNAADRKGG